jgi:hypothetical protein
MLSFPTQFKEQLKVVHNGNRWDSFDTIKRKERKSDWDPSAAENRMPEPYLHCPFTAFIAEYSGTGETQALHYALRRKG